MKEQKQQEIPLHKMDSISSLGLQFHYMELSDEYNEAMLKSSKNVAHRDDYYLFLFTECTDSIYILDFEEMSMAGQSILYIRPGQVHFATLIQEARGWSLAIDPILIKDEYKTIFEEQLATQRAMSLDTSAFSKISKTAQL